MAKKDLLTAAYITTRRDTARVYAHRTTARSPLDPLEEPARSSKSRFPHQTFPRFLRPRSRRRAEIIDSRIHG